MIQTFLKASWNLGWGSSFYRIGLGGQGGTTFFFNDDASIVVVPITGTFRNLIIYSPAGDHPNYTATLYVNGVASTLTCALLTADDVASDNTHEVSVVAGDDIFISVNVNPLGAGTGYPLNFSLEFEGNQQFYSISSGANHTSGDYGGGGALGNGVIQTAYIPTALSNTYSICTTPGTLTGIRSKDFSTNNVGGGYTAYISLNQVLQDGSGGTVNTACSWNDGDVGASSSFSLPIVIGDHVEFALLRTGANAVF